MQIKVFGKHKGFGDTVEALAKAVYADKIAEAIARGVGAEDCGCNGRKEELNNPDLLVNKLFYGVRKDGEVL